MSNQKKTKTEVHKFGGTSLANADCYQAVADILQNQSAEKTTVVVSAMATMTNNLLACCAMAANQDENYKTTLNLIAEKQLSLLDALGISGLNLRARLKDDLKDITELLRGVWLIQQDTNEVAEFVSGYGEKWSARAMSALLNKLDSKAVSVDATEFLVVADGLSGKQVNWGETTRLFDQKMMDSDAEITVVTGYVARQLDGSPTTLGRNGSDYSAAIMAALVDAEKLTIWTDVDGVLSANPREVPTAHVLHEMSYDEAFELAYFGAKVIHPQTMTAVIENNIPVYIRNTFRPAEPGTRISDKGVTKFAAKGLTTIDDLALINIEGNGMIGVPGIAEKVFRTLHNADISVVMISQGSSEHSICVAINQRQSDVSLTVLDQEFAGEIQRGKMNPTSRQNNIAILALVGDALAGHSGVAGQFLSALGDAGVNVHAIAQGSSERNISVAIKSERRKYALQVVHDAFYQKKTAETSIYVGLLGLGTVGRALLDQLQAQQQNLVDQFGVALKIGAIANSRQMILSDDNITSNLVDNPEAVDANLDQLVHHLKTVSKGNKCVLIDCTTSARVSEQYLAWLNDGINVVTANKKANSAGQKYYNQLQDVCQQTNFQFRYETNVGAGLPVIETVKDLIATGDKINQISGIFSGTMAYLFNQYDGQKSFAKLVDEARIAGFTEPDPRDDLSGMDVARKVLILARSAGGNMELSDIKVESLVPNTLKNVDSASFLTKFADFDHQIKAKFDQAKAEGKVLRYVGSFSPENGGEVRLEFVEPQSALGNIQLTDNVVEIYSERYNQNPLVIKGPGAGAEVTAGGLFADLLKICRC